MLQKYTKLNPLITQNLQPSEVRAIELHFSNKQIKDYIDNDFAKLDKLLLTISKFAGISTAPDAATRQMIMMFMKEKFGDFTRDDVEQAFMKAMAFEIQVDDIESYNKLSGQWVSSILFAYRNFRNKAVLKYQSEQLAIDEKEKNDPSQSEQDRIMKEACIRSFSAYQNDPDRNLIDLGAAKYSYLERQGVLHFSTKEKNVFMETARRKHEDQLMAKKLSSNAFKMKEIDAVLNALTQGEETAKLINMAKVLALKECFNKLIKQEKNLEELL